MLELLDGVNFFSYVCSDNLDSTSILENSLSAKEKMISELNMELHNVETTLSNEREQHINEVKKLNAIINEKVCSFWIPACCTYETLSSMCFTLFDQKHVLYSLGMIM